MNQPNILLIIADQHRGDTLGHRDETPCKTPTLDKLAKEGISFLNAQTTCPLCLPARSSLFTGLFPHQNNMLDNYTGELKPETETLFKSLKEANYHIDYAGKWHMSHVAFSSDMSGTESKNISIFTDRYAGENTQEYSKWCADNNLPDGWALNDPETRSKRTPHMSIPRTDCMNLKADQTNDGWVADKAINFIKTRPKNKPYFLTCSFNGPHPPFVIPEPYFSMYEEMCQKKPLNWGIQESEKEITSPSFYHQLFEDFGEDFDTWKKSYETYWGFVSLIDDQVKRLITTLEEEDIKKDTIIIYLSDHGELLGSHGLWQKMTSHKESTHVPLIMSLPNGQEISLDPNKLVSMVDLYPTIMHLCGLPFNQENHPGHNLFDPHYSWDDRYTFCEHKSLGEWMNFPDWKSVRNKNFKYTEYINGQKSFYDLQNDPEERYNIIENKAFNDEIKKAQDVLTELLKQY